MPSLFGVNFGGSAEAASGSQATSAIEQQKGTQTSQLSLDPMALDRILRQGMQNGMADILSGKNLVGGTGSSTQDLQAQDFMSTLMSDLATKLGRNVVTSDMTGQSTSETKSKSKKGGIKTVICTKLRDLGFISDYLYLKGNLACGQIDPVTYVGYRAWADKVVPTLGAKNPKWTSFWTYVVKARYHYYITPKQSRHHSVGSFISVKILDPISRVIGKYLIHKEFKQMLKGI